MASYNIYGRLVVVLIALFCGTMTLWTIVYNAPKIEAESIQQLHFPSSVEDVRSLFSTLSLYKEVNANYVFLLFSAAYIFKQTFAIPGSFLLNVLAGALFGVWPTGLPLCCSLTAIGATFSYLLSQFAGKEILTMKFPVQIALYKSKIVKNSGQLLLFLISLRLFPATPNWLLNVMSPIVDIPLCPFFLSVLIGLIPYNFLCIQAGETLSDLNDMNVLSAKRLITLVVLASICYGLSRYSKKEKKV